MIKNKLSQVKCYRQEDSRQLADHVDSAVRAMHSVALCATTFEQCAPFSKRDRQYRMSISWGNRQKRVTYCD